ncbi:MAG: glycosyltransferase family 2 protein [Gloeomargarita sp. DG02_4_bins_56]
MSSLGWVTTILFVLAALLGIVEATATWLGYRTITRHRLRRQLHRRDVQLPRYSVIVVAYLPNEQEIILDTLTHLLTQLPRPQAGLEIILAYNRPQPLPIEGQLQHLAAHHPELKLLHVEGSRSKAENLNAAIHLITGEMTLILDADLQPAPASVRRAWRWLAGGQYDVVQGRNVIRNAQDNLLTRVVAVEFEHLYGVSHPARSLLADLAIFGGSNGYWRTTVLRGIRFNPQMLTEDIDVTLKLLLRGYRIIHDRDVIATELAPVDGAALWSQRRRWAQGWLQVGLKYTWPIVQSEYLSLGQKIYLLCMFICGIALHFTVIYYPLVLYHELASLNSLPAPTLQWFGWVTALLLVSSPYQVFVAHQGRTAHSPWNGRDSLLYCFVLPIYSFFKNLVSLVAVYYQLIGRQDWVVTRRGTLSQPLIR